MDSNIKKLLSRQRIGLVTAYLFIISYVVYFILYEYSNYRLDQLYFSINVFTASVWLHLLFDVEKNIHTKVAYLFASSFTGALFCIYVFFWLILNKPYAEVKYSLIIGLLFGLFYYVRDIKKRRKQQIYDQLGHK